MKRILTVMMMAVGMAAFADGPAVSNVRAQQRYPWNGLVDIDYTITGDTTGLGVSILVKDLQNNKEYAPTKFMEALPTGVGTHRVTWSMAAEGVNVVSTNIIVTVSLVRGATPTPTGDGLYCVIDLSGGASASSYPVSYVSSVPAGGFNTDEYKTTKLVLRKIDAGTFMMGGSKSTTISKPFYIGVFQVTQKQYELVMGSNPSLWKGDTRPVEYVSYDMIRGSSAGSGWPTSATVDGDSFLGKIQSRTGLNLDLPTEAQWEYACRAGTTSTYNNGGSTEDDLKLLGRYSGNRNDGRGGYSQHTAVGSYAPNTWGLYDMHGNVFEWCLDWYGTLAGGTDPKGAGSGSYRVRRGGCSDYDASSCTSSYRNNGAPSGGGGWFGFRLCCSAGLLPTGEHEMVQLWEGGPYWATTNIGAEKPEDYGYYFWWGDTVGYTNTGSGWISVKDGTSISFSSSDGTAASTYLKDNSALQSEGWIDSTTNLVAVHDAAHVHWGGNWRMPTYAEMFALISNCTTEWITTNGVYGRLVTGSGAYANRSIFLPAAGYGSDSYLLYSGSYGNCWSSTPASNGSYLAWYLYFSSGDFYRGGYEGRYYGQSVRPVRGFAE